MITHYIYISIFIVAFVGAWFAIISAVVNFIKMLGHVKPAPFLIKLTGCAHVMKKYLTEEGVSLRNKAFTYILLFLDFWAIAFSTIIQTNPDKWEEMKIEYNDWKNSLKEKPPSFPF